MMTGDAGMPPKTDKVTAVRWTGSMDAEGFPPDAAWETVPGVQFDWDWQGANADPARETQVRLLWTREMLFVEFRAKYRNIRFTMTPIRAGGAISCGTKTFANCFCRATHRSRGNIRSLKLRRTGIGSISISISMAGASREARSDERIEAAREY